MGLYISMNMPGHELSKSPIDDAVTFLASQIAIEKRNGNIPEEPSLDITFMLPGKYEKPTFKGMRMGGYTKGNKTLYFETAVPEHITLSEKASNYIASVLEDMIGNAEIFFTGSGVNFDADLWRTALQRLTRAETSDTQN